MDFSCLLDNNVFESLSEPVADQAGRFLLQVSGKKTSKHPYSVGLLYKGGFEGYIDHNIEDRMIHDGKVTLEVPVFRPISMGCKLNGRTKTFFRSVRGFILYHVSPFIRFSPLRGLSSSVYMTYSHLDYVRGTYFDTRYFGMGLSVAYMPRNGLKLDFDWSVGTSGYERNAFAFESQDTAYTWIDLGVWQEDRFHEIAFEVEVYRRWLLHVGFAYQRSISNSYGYSYECPRVWIMCAKTFPWDLTLTLYGTLQWKRYLDSIQPLLQIRPDAESEESNFAVVEISKDVFKTYSIRFRLAWYKNESFFRSTYYEKRLISIGLTKRF